MNAFMPEVEELEISEADEKRMNYGHVTYWKNKVTTILQVIICLIY